MEVEARADPMSNVSPITAGGHLTQLPLFAQRILRWPEKLASVVSVQVQSNALTTNVLQAYAQDKPLLVSEAVIGSVTFVTIYDILV